MTFHKVRTSTTLPNTACSSSSLNYAIAESKTEKTICSVFALCQYALFSINGFFFSCNN